MKARKKNCGMNSNLVFIRTTNSLNIRHWKEAKQSKNNPKKETQEREAAEKP